MFHVPFWTNIDVFLVFWIIFRVFLQHFLSPKYPFDVLMYLYRVPSILDSEGGKYRDHTFSHHIYIYIYYLFTSLQLAFKY